MSNWKGWLAACGRSRRGMIAVLWMWLTSLVAQPGKVDPTFTPPEELGAFVLLPGGQILAVNPFSSSASLRAGARLYANGRLDANFRSPGADGWITHIVPLPDGKVILGGDYGRFGGQLRIRLARVLENGSLDPDWNAGNALERQTIGALGLQPDGSLLVGQESIGGVTANDGLFRLGKSGQKDESFAANGAINGAVHVLKVLEDGGFYVGGEFTRVHGVSRPGIARLDADGKLDAAFNPGTGPDTGVVALALDADGRLLIAGSFTKVDGRLRGGVARLRADGSLDESFDSHGVVGVKSVAVQGDGKVLIAGLFSDVQDDRRAGIARLNPDGSLDRDFLGPEGNYGQVAVQPDGRILLDSGVRLLPDDPGFPGRFELRPGRVEVVEGDGPVELTVERIGGAHGEASVGYVVSSFGQELGRGRVRFGEGERTRVLQIPIEDDRVVRLGRSVFVGLIEPSPGAQVGYRFNSEIVVAENDTGFRADELMSVYEIEGVAVVHVWREGADFTPMHVNYRTVDGSAKAGTDYVGAAGVLDFEEDEVVRVIPIRLIDDPRVAGLRRFSLVIENPDGGAVISGPGITAINLLDSVSRVSIAGNATVMTNESAGTVSIPILREGRTNSTATVRFETVDGTAHAGVDFESSQGTATFAPGEASVEVRVPLKDNAAIQPDRSFMVRIFEPGEGAELGFLPDDTVRTVNIIDDDRPSALDLAFNPSREFWFSASLLTVDPKQRILATSPGGGLWRILPDGSTDARFNPPPFSSSPGGKWIGNDERIWPEPSVFQWDVLAEDGSVSAHLNGALANRILAMQPDQKFIGTALSQIGSAAGGVVRIKPDGTLDPEFQDRGALELAVLAAAVQGDGHIVCAGYSLSPGGGSCLARLKPDGASDTVFASKAPRFSRPAGLGAPTIYNLTLLPDGHMIVAGSFDAANEHEFPNIARLNPDGSLDENWNPDPVGMSSVSQVVLQGNGRLLVRGTTEPPPRFPVQRLIRLEANGRRDSSFAFDEVTDLSDVAVQADGRILLAGGNLGRIPLTRYAVARLVGDPDAAGGSVSFTETPALVEESAGVVRFQVARTGGNHGRIVVPYAVSGGTAREGRDFTGARGTLEFADGESGPKPVELTLLTDGVADGNQSLQLSLGMPIGAALRGDPSTAAVIIRDADCAVGFATAVLNVREDVGIFRIPVQRTGDVRRPGSVAYFTRPGTAVPEGDYGSASGLVHFDPGQVWEEIILTVINDTWSQPDQSFFVELSTPTEGCTLGAIPRVRVVINDDDRPGTLRWAIARTNLPPWILPGKEEESRVEGVRDLTLDADGNAVALFEDFDSGSSEGSGHATVLRFDPKGALDWNVVPNRDPRGPTFTGQGAECIAVLPDRSFLVGTSTGLVHVDAGGNPVPGAFGGVDGRVRVLDVDAQGSFLVGGELKLGKPDVWWHLVRRKVDGQPDEGFHSLVLQSEDGQGQFNPSVGALARDSVGRILIGGHFSAVNGVPRLGLARLTDAGDVDPAFNASIVLAPLPNSDLTAEALQIAPQPDGRILIVGWFDHVGNVPRPGIARLMTDGSLDRSFAPVSLKDALAPAYGVGLMAVAVQEDGRILAGGWRQIPGGFDSTSMVGFVVRMNSDGSLDPLFDVNTYTSSTPGSPFAWIRRLVVAPDSSVLAGGVFSAANGVPAVGLVRIEAGTGYGFGGVRWMPSNQLKLEIRLPVAREVILQASPDFHTWTSVLTNALPAGNSAWEVPVNTGQGAAFFRLRVRP